MTDEVDPVLDVLERYLLGGERTLTRLDVAEQAGVPQARSELLWRALGFSRVGDEDVFFGEADVRALRLAKEFIEVGLVDESTELTLVRTLGRSYARLADWQSRLFTEIFDLAGDVSPETVQAVVEEFVPRFEAMQAYIWRRAILASVSRMILRPVGEEGSEQTVGFADIVGYTSQSRQLTASEFEELMEHFEQVSLTIVTEHGGRIIKTIGDEILFTADDPPQAARIALDLVESHRRDERYPEVRAGLAHGIVLERLGDVYGSVVNLAARLTSLARPGRVLIDRSLREQLVDSEEFVVRRMRRTSVKGFERVEPFRLKRPREREDEPEGKLGKAGDGLREVIEETIEDVSPDVVRRRRS